MIRAVLPSLVVACGALFAKDLHACQRLVLGDQVLDDNRSVPNLDLPDYRYSGTGGFLDSAYQCSAGFESMLIDMPDMGLTYVRDIQYEGVTFAAYRMSERSPLVAFQYQFRSVGFTAYPVPLHPGRINRMENVTIPHDAELNAGVVVMYFLPGGAMESVPYRHLGTITSWPESDPTQILRHSISLGFNVPVLTCSLRDQSVSLADVSADDLAIVGSTAAEMAVAMTMSCPSANVDVTFSLADANDATNRSSVLAATASTTASGVRVEMLRNGVPVSLQQPWHGGFSSKGAQAVSFSARYLRMAEPLQPGVVEGQAVLTATYR